MKFTIIGGGHVGTLMALRFLRDNIPVRFYDAGNIYGQVPWGWFRRVSLQPKVRMANPEDRSRNSRLFETFSLSGVKPRYGKMLLTTSSKDRIKLWQSWLDANPESTAKILDPSPETFNLTGFLCDKHDFIVNLQEVNRRLKEILRTNNYCEYVNAKAENIKIIRDKAHVSMSNGDVVIPYKSNRVVMAIGNQTDKLISGFHPVVKLEMPWAWVEYKGDKLPYGLIGLWNNKSSIQVLDNRFKIGCGSEVLFHSLRLSYLRHFAGLTRWGLNNVNFGDRDKLVSNALEELDKMGIETRLQEVSSCVVDITPNFVPMVRYHGGMLVIAGFSGSGFTAYEPWFQDAVLDYLRNPAVRPARLEYFDSNIVYNERVKFYLSILRK